MKRILTKNVLTLLAIIVTIVVLHSLQSFKRGTSKLPAEAAVVKKGLAG